VAQLIQPDYLTVMTESDTEEEITGQTNLNTVAGVTQLVQQVLTTLQTGGVTNVQVGGGVGTWTENYMQYVQSLASLPMDFVDMHIYPINNNFFTNAITAATAIHAAGKQVGLSECWDWKILDSELGSAPSWTEITSRDPFSFWEPIDIAFLRAIVDFANYKQLAFVSPYWVHYFFAYLDYNTYGSMSEDEIMTNSYTAADSAVLAGAFTPTGHAWERQNIPRDTTPPAMPAAPTTSAIGPTAINLQWAPDTDDVGVAAYNLYRNGSLLSTTSQTLYYDSGLVSGETYTYNLVAFDAIGNVSSKSPPLVVETIDITAPSVPTSLVVTGVTSNSVSLNWTPSTGVGGVGGYRVLQGTLPTAMSIRADVTAPPFTSTVASSTTYYFAIESYNPNGVTSAPSNQVTATTPAPLGSIPPSIPTNLVVTGVTSSSITLSWTPSTGAAGVGGYRILSGTTPGSLSIRADVPAPPYAVAVAPSTTYYYEVESYNPDGVTSGPSNQVTATTPAPIGSIPPSVPTNLVVTSVASGSVSLNWTPSTGPAGVGGYRILQGLSPGAMSIRADAPAPPYSVTVAPSTTYYYEVQSYNPNGVLSGPSNMVTATTPAPIGSIAPSAPTNLVVTSVGSNSVSLNWTPSTGPAGVGGYWILQGASPDAMSIRANVPGPPYTLAVRPGKTFYIQVESYNPNKVASGPSNQVTATTPATQ
jgi:fibronectin type 3 domain-containing protein